MGYFFYGKDSEAPAGGLDVTVASVAERDRVIEEILVTGEMQGFQARLGFALSFKFFFSACLKFSHFAG